MNKNNTHCHLLHLLWVMVTSDTQWVKNLPNCKRYRDREFEFPTSVKILLEKEWRQPTPVFCLRKIPWQRNLTSYSPMIKFVESDMTERIKFARMHTPHSSHSHKHALIVLPLLSQKKSVPYVGACLERLWELLYRLSETKVLHMSVCISLELPNRIFWFSVPEIH